MGLVDRLVSMPGSRIILEPGQEVILRWGSCIEMLQCHEFGVPIKVYLAF